MQRRRIPHRGWICQCWPSLQGASGMASLPQPGYSLASAALASRKPPPASLLTRIPATASRWRAGGRGLSRGVSLGVPLWRGSGRFAFGGFHFGLPSTGHIFTHVKRALGRVVVTLAP